MSSWPLKPLGKICSTTSGGTPSRSHPEYFGGEIPWVKSGDLTDGVVVDCDETITEEALRNSSAKLFQQGTVLIAMYGATVGKLGMLGREAATNQAVCGISTPDELDRWFLFYFLLSQRRKLIEQSTGGAQPNISQKIVRELLLPVPPISEQRRIVDLLSRAEGIVRLRRDAKKKAAKLIPALFLNMFGDPATNPKGWPLARLGEISTVKGGGTPSKANPAYWAGDIPWISPKDMSGVERISDAIDHISQEALSGSATNLIPSGAILVVTRSGVLKHSLPCAITSRPVAINQDIKAFLPSERTHPNFLLAQLQVRSREILALVRVGATVQNIETDALKRLHIPLPPKSLQTEFSQRVEQVQSIRTQQSAATASAQATFDALLAEAFNN